MSTGQVAAMIDVNRLRELTAELGFMPATTDEAGIDRHRQRNKNADYWLVRSHRLSPLRREHERRIQRQNPDGLWKAPPTASGARPQPDPDACSGPRGDRDHPAA